MQDEKAKYDEPALGEEVAEDEAREAASEDFVNRWHQLVSVTNWEKGRIICDWRDRLIEGGAPVTEYSDEAWSTRVGNVSSQHVGRLRRTYRRFGEVYEDYQGLFWSHFHAALDWNDAEMWLEGSVQNRWSISQLRDERWKALGAPDELKPSDDEVVTAEWDEDGGPSSPEGAPRTVPSAVAEVQDPGGSDHEAPEKRSDEGGRQTDSAVARSAISGSETTSSSPEPKPRRRLFEDLAALPDDLSEALEAFKLAIVNHKLSGWAEIGPDDVLASLEALVQLVQMPPDDED